MSEKQKIITDVYFDRAGFGSKSRTLEEAREKDNTITMSDINEFFSKNVDQKRKPVGSNSFIALHSAYEYQNAFTLGRETDVAPLSLSAGSVQSSVEVLAPSFVFVSVCSCTALFHAHTERKILCHSRTECLVADHVVSRLLMSSHNAMGEPLLKRQRLADVEAGKAQVLEWLRGELLDLEYEEEDVTIVTAALAGYSRRALVEASVAHLTEAINTQTTDSARSTALAQSLYYRIHPEMQSSPPASRSTIT